MPHDNLFHVREAPLKPGSLIEPGRWGATILRQGQEHPFFFREHLLETWRLLRTTDQVSRLSCTFAYEGQEQAERYVEPGEAVMAVTPADPLAPSMRLDMLWLTWVGEPGATTEKVMYWCSEYWSGRSTMDLNPEATPSWEWLFSCPLRVIG